MIQLHGRFSRFLPFSVVFNFDFELRRGMGKNIDNGLCFMFLGTLLCRGIKVIDFFTITMSHEWEEDGESDRPRGRRPRRRRYCLSPIFVPFLVFGACVL